MKKFMMIAVMAVAALTANAQNYYGSKEGGFAITFNANPLINYVGNMFNGNTNNQLKDFNGLKNELFSGTTITGKYFLKDNLAIDLGFGFDNEYNTKFTYDSKEYDKELGYTKNATSAFMIKGGVSYNLRPGQRLQPVLGADLVYVHENGWDYSEATDGDNKDAYQYGGAPVNKIGLMASAGVEYFVTKQISVGATVDFGVAKAWNGSSYDRDNKKEKEDGYRVNSTTTKILTGNFGGNLSLNFYF